MLIPSPLHRRRQGDRRVNQSALIAQKMAHMAGIECCLGGLKKCRRMPELKEHTAEERRTLLHGSMAVNLARARYVAGREWVVVDDVFTARAAWSEAARACGAVGGKCVRVRAVARTAKII